MAQLMSIVNILAILRISGCDIVAVCHCIYKSTSILYQQTLFCMYSLLFDDKTKETALFIAAARLERETISVVSCCWCKRQPNLLVPLNHISHHYQQMPLKN